MKKLDYSTEKIRMRFQLKAMKTDLMQTEKRMKQIKMELIQAGKKAELLKVKIKKMDYRYKKM